MKGTSVQQRYADGVAFAPEDVGSAPFSLASVRGVGKSFHPSAMCV